MKRCRPSEKSLLGKNWVFQWGKQERKQLDRGGLRHLRAAKECANGLIGPCCSSTWSAGVTSKCCSSSGSGYIVALMPEEEENPRQPRQRHPTPACLDFHLRDRELCRLKVQIYTSAMRLKVQIYTSTMRLKVENELKRGVGSRAAENCGIG